MKRRVGPGMIFVLLAALVCACQPELLSSFKTRSSLKPTLAPEPPAFSAIVFCREVTGDGRPIGPATEFPAGTRTVWALFTYAHLSVGQSWGRVWEKDGQISIDARPLAWNRASEGWAAYSITGDGLDQPLVGRYVLKLYLDGVVVQQASFSVPPPPPPRSPLG